MQLDELSGHTGCPTDADGAVGDRGFRTGIKSGPTMGIGRTGIMLEIPICLPY
jgi:hypothetical protein